MIAKKTYASNFIHHDFIQFGKQDSRYKAILLSILLPQQCCEVHFISLTVAIAFMRLDYQLLPKLPPTPNLLAGSARGSKVFGISMAIKEFHSHGSELLHEDFSTATNRPKRSSVSDLQSNLRFLYVFANN